MLGDKWITDRTPTERFPAYTRSNAGEALVDPVSPLGWTFMWESGVVLGCRDGPSPKFPPQGVAVVDRVAPGQHRNGSPSSPGARRWRVQPPLPRSTWVSNRPREPRCWAKVAGWIRPASATRRPSPKVISIASRVCDDCIEKVSSDSRAMTGVVTVIFRTPFPRILRSRPLHPFGGSGLIVTN